MQEDKKMEYVLISTTIDTQKAAQKLASDIVKHKLGACVHIHPVTSIYTWNDKMYEESEYKLEIKTTARLSRKCQDFIIGVHTYDLPEIIETQITDGSSEYLRWIKENTAS